MKKETNKKRKPINGWKLTAILSLIVNGIVALLLTIGLASPKPTTKVSASNDNPYHYYDVYSIDASSRSATIKSQSFLQELHDAYEYTTGYIQYGSNSEGFWYFFSASTGGFELGLLDYQYNLYYEGFTDFRFTYNNNAELMYVTAWPTDNTSSYYFWLYNNGSNYGFNDNVSRLRFRSNNSYLNRFFAKTFFDLGSEELLTNYTADNYFNPNKYISIQSDSLGFLYDSPNDFYNVNYLSPYRVKWYAPRYIADGVDGGEPKVSTLGWLEIPIIFSSNGEIFNGIRFYYDVVQYYKDSNNELQVLQYTGNQDHYYHYTFAYMSYVYDLSTALGPASNQWREKVVCATPIYQISRSYYRYNTEYRAYIYYQNQPLKWLSDSYKTINLHDFSKSWLDVIGIQENINISRFAINNLTIVDILSYDMTSTSPNISNNVGIGNVFVLIRNGFESIIPMLSLAILPGISIGMLLFMPLVLTIIIVIIKLVKR